MDGKVAEEVQVERMNRLMQLQSGISKRRNRRLIGAIQPILVEGPSAESEFLWEGRLESQAPEIDGVVYLTDGVGEQTPIGEVARVLITEAHEYDLVGTLVSEGA